MDKITLSEKYVFNWSENGIAFVKLPSSAARRAATTFPQAITTHLQPYYIKHYFSSK